MKPITFKYKQLPLLIVFLITAASCGAPDSPGSNSESENNTSAAEEDATPPVLSSTPANNAIISNTQTITISADESLHRLHTSTDGTMLFEHDSIGWKDGASVDSIMQIKPFEKWSDGTHTLQVTTEDLSGNTAALNLTFTVDGSIASASTDPVDTSILLNTQPVIITFSEGMDVSTLSVSGTLYSDSDGGQWSNTTVENDTLTFLPLSQWTAGTSLTLTVNIKDFAGNAVPELNLTYSVDSQNPAATASTATGSAIGATEAIVITFDESIDTESLNLAGSLSAHGTASWSTTTSANDTLTISPDSTWPSGDVTLTVDCNDLNGNALPTLNLSYGILSGAVYVKTTGSDSDPGTKTSPRLTVQAAIDTAVDQGISEVHVAGGTYQLHSQSGGYISMKNGVDLLGGYDPTDWNTRNISTYTTTIEDTSTAGFYNTVIYSDSSVSTDTLIEGFTLITGSGDINYAFEGDETNITLKNNTFISGGSGTVKLVTQYGSYMTVEGNTFSGSTGSGNLYAIDMQYTFLTGSSITGNTITLGTGNQDVYGIYDKGYYDCNCGGTITNNEVSITSGDSTYGIYKRDTNPTVTGNVVDAGDGSTSSVALFVRYWQSDSLGYDLDISNNTLLGGTAATSAGLYIDYWNPLHEGDVKNNIIDAQGSTTGTSYGIQLYQAGNQDFDIMNNTISGGTGGTAIGLYMVHAYPGLVNNIIYTESTATNRYCITENAADKSPAVMANNNLFNCPTALYSDYTNGVITTASDLNDDTLTTQGGAGTAVGNISADAVLADTAGGDYSPTASSPCTSTQGGLNLSAMGETWFNDLNGTNRTTDWSIGAVEWDGSCL